MAELPESAVSVRGAPGRQTMLGGGHPSTASAAVDAGQLRAALQERDVIATAKGILMATKRCGAEQALEELLHRSEAGAPLVVVCADVVREFEAEVLDPSRLR